MVIERSQSIPWDVHGRQFSRRRRRALAVHLLSLSPTNAWPKWRMSSAQAWLLFLCIKAHKTSLGIRALPKLLSIAPVKMSKVLFQCSRSGERLPIKLVWCCTMPSASRRSARSLAATWGITAAREAAISASGKPDMHADFGLPLPMMRHTEFPHFYRRHRRRGEQFATRMADALEALIVAEGPETVGGFIAEPVMGAGDAHPPPRTYWEKMQAVLRKPMSRSSPAVICGFGRTATCGAASPAICSPT